MASEAAQGLRTASFEPGCAASAARLYLVAASVLNIDGLVLNPLRHDSCKSIT